MTSTDKSDARSRKSCDNCGREFRTGYFGNDCQGGGWSAQGTLYRIDGRWYHLCCDECSWAVGRWVHNRKLLHVSTPRLIGRETVASVLKG